MSARQVIEYKDDHKCVRKWGPSGEEANFIQQTMNCFHCCEMATKNLKEFPQDWSVCLNSDFICTLDEKVNTKRTKSNLKLMSQKFWMFHRADKQEIYVVFPSQETTAHILVDSNIWTMPKQKDIRNVDNISISFFKALILRGYDLVFTGHSLGGALAIMVTCKLVNKDLEQYEIKKIRCITFGAPQVPCTKPDQMLEFKDIIYRYELPDDPVPELLTAFQTNDNSYQEFLVNLMNFQGIQHSLRNAPDVELGLVDYITCDESVVEKIKMYSEFGTVLIPSIRQRGWFSPKTDEYGFAHTSFWKFLGKPGQKEVEIQLHQFINQLKANHQFQRYKQEILEQRIALLGLPKVGDEFKNSDMGKIGIRLPNSKYWIQGPEDIKLHNTQLVAYFEERFTRVVLRSVLPHVFGVRFAQVEEFPGWGIESAKVIKDRQPFEVVITFYSAQDYTKLKEKKVTTLSVSLQGYFESIENFKVKVEESTVDEAGEMRNLAYKNINVNYLYTSAFQACLFAGEGHNPMLLKDDLREENREALLQEDRNLLVEILGSLIVNQELFKIISQEFQLQFEGIVSPEIIQKAPITTQYLKKIDTLYNKFEFTFTKRASTQNLQDVNTKKMVAKDCITESIPILFCLSVSLVWKMKTYFWFTKAVPLVPTLIHSVGSVGLVAVSLGTLITSLNTIREFSSNDYQNYEQIQMQYKLQLLILVNRLGFQAKESHSIADLEKIIADMCKWLLKQEEIGYEYEQSENQLNKILLIQTDNQSAADNPTTQRDFLQQLIKRKVNTLGHKSIFKNCDKQIRLSPSKWLAALLIFVWNNYRIRRCLSKTWRIGIMGMKNSGKSSLARMLGCQIPPGENHPTEDVTLYNNVPAKNFCVIDFPHLDNVDAKNYIRMSYSLVDIAIIVTKCQDRVGDDQNNLVDNNNKASYEGINQEVGQIIKAMNMKHSNLGFGNRKYPILLLLNQVDKMVFNENGEDPDDEELTENFQNQQDQIFNDLKAAGVDIDQLECLFTSLQPNLPKLSQEKLNQWLQDSQNNKITQEEYIQKINQVDKNRLQQVTNCSFFKFEKEVQQNENSVVNVLAEMVENLGDRDESNSLRAVFHNHEDAVDVNESQIENN